MHLGRFRLILAAVLTVAALMLALNMGTVGAAPMTASLIQSHSHQRQIGTQSHVGKQQTNRTGSKSVTPADTIYCTIFDGTSKSGSEFLLKVGVECPVPANMTMKLYWERCGYWDYSSHTCAGGWYVAGGAVVCTPTNVIYAECPPGSPWGVYPGSGSVVQAQYTVSTDIPGTTPEVVTQTYYSGAYFF